VWGVGVSRKELGKHPGGGGFSHCHTACYPNDEGRVRHAIAQELPRNGVNVASALHIKGEQPGERLVHLQHFLGVQHVTRGPNAS